MGLPGFRFDASNNIEAPSTYSACEIKGKTWSESPTQKMPETPAKDGIWVGDSYHVFPLISQAL